MVKYPIPIRKILADTNCQCCAHLSAIHIISQSTSWFNDFPADESIGASDLLATLNYVSGFFLSYFLYSFPYAISQLLNILDCTVLSEHSKYTFRQRNFFIQWNSY